MPGWLTDLSANKFNNTYFRDADEKGFAVDMSGDLVVRGAINTVYDSLPTFTSSQIGYTIEKYLATESGNSTNGNRYTGTTTTNIPIGVYTAIHYFQMNVLNGTTKRRQVRLMTVSGAQIANPGNGWVTVAAVAEQEYVYNQIPYIVKVTSTTNSFRVYVGGSRTGLNQSRVTFVRIA